MALGIPLTVLQSKLDADYPSSGTFYLWLLRDTGPGGRSSYIVDPSGVNASTGEITVEGNNFLVDTPVEFQGPGSPATADVTYWVKTKVGDVITLAVTKGGTALTLAAPADGFAIQDKELDYRIEPNPPLAQIARKEINYQGIASRPTFTPPSPKTIDATLNRAFFEITLSLDNASDPDIVEYDKVAIIQGGSATPGTTTGTLKAIFPMGGVIQVPGGSSRNLRLNIPYTNITA
jgi:hypothetical protein